MGNLRLQNITVNAMPWVQCDQSWRNFATFANFSKSLKFSRGFSIGKYIEATLCNNFDIGHFFVVVNWQILNK